MMAAVVVVVELLLLLLLHRPLPILKVVIHLLFTPPAPEAWFGNTG